MKKTPFSAIILAAGQGTRMNSPLPKVLHPVAGYPMIHRVVTAVGDAGAEEIRVVIGYGADLVRRVVEPLGATCFVQKSQEGTAHAVKSAEPETLTGHVLILNGDHPLITAEDIKKMVQAFNSNESSLSVMSAELKKPKNFGRIVRHHGALQYIIEASEASAETLKISEVNTGIYMLSSKYLNEYIYEIQNYNAQNEYYLTDLVAFGADAGEKLEAIKVPPRICFGVNTQMELSQATLFIFKRKAKSLLEKGVILIDPKSTYIEDEVEIEAGTIIYPNVYIKGKTQIGGYCIIEANCHILESQIGESTQIKAGTYINKSKVGDRVSLGPYAHLRASNTLGDEVKVGNFVELKKAHLADGVKAGHLTYLGDATIGERTNIGCGTITCNYAVDRKKYLTKIGKDVFVGSDTQFIAPVEIGDEAVIASGSTITKDVPEKALAMARGRQKIKENYQSIGVNTSSTSTEETKKTVKSSKVEDSKN